VTAVDRAPQHDERKAGVDISETLDSLVDQLESARAMPMSASCIVNRSETIDALEAIRASLPRELVAARKLLADRAAVIEQGRVEAQAIIDAAKAERDRLVSGTEVAAAASAEADRMVDAAQAQIDRMRLEVDEYVDAKLANFEIVLHKTLGAVERGREKISGRHDELAALSDPDPDAVAEPLPG
jgi:F0F1-type ATP synthase membrane subunit b/b'